MRFFCFLLLFVTSINVKAINDSLIVEFNKALKIRNRSKISQLAFKIGNEYHRERIYHVALTYYDRGIKYCDDDGLKADLLRKTGQVYVDSTNYGQALIYLDRSLILYEKLDKKEELSNVLNLKGMCYGLTNDLDKSLSMFKRSLNFKKQLNDSVGIGTGYFNIGLVHYFKGEYKLAMDNYIRSLRIREKLGDTTEIVNSLTTVGEVCRIRKEYDKAMDYYQQAIGLRNGITSDQILAYIYSEIALIYKLNKEYPKSLAYIDTAMMISNRCGYKRGMATLNSYKAGIMKIMGNLDEASSLYNIALEDYYEIHFEIGVVQTKSALAEISIIKNDFGPALKLLNSVEPLAQNNGLLEEQVEIARLYYQLYKSTGKTGKALNAHENYMVLKDSLINTENEKQIQKIETEYHVEKKENQIIILDKENKIQQQKLNFQKYVIIAISVLVLLIIMIAILFIKQNKLRYQLLAENNKQKLLRSQMNPHFIYNSLSAIQNFILQNDTIESVSYIAEFSGLMRLVLEGSRKELVTLKEDIDLNNYYLKLQQLRFNKDFDFTIEVSPELNQEVVKIPPMLIQPFIENAVEHGMRSMEKHAGMINLKYNMSNDCMMVIVEDNGPGNKMEEKQSKNNHVSLATQITKERIHNVEKLQKMKILLDINSNFNEKQEGFMVQFTLPIK
ncbi:MAG: tetratricopeptide repeat protein [Bacteroidales bacterium]|nr:tetratricopeptide repeat protein [Bacteroidales bacterium]